MASNTLIGEVIGTPILQKIVLSAAGDDGMLNTAEEVSLFLKTCDKQKDELKKENIVVTDLGNSKFTIEKTTKDIGKSTVHFDLNEDSLVEIIEAGLAAKAVATYNNNQLNCETFWLGIYTGKFVTNLETKESVAENGGIIGSLTIMLSALLGDLKKITKCGM